MSSQEQTQSQNQNVQPEKSNPIGANIPSQVIPQPNLLEQNPPQEIQKSHSTLYKGAKQKKH